MTTKLEIIGPYTPEHEGPFCTRDKKPVEIITKNDRDGNILGYVGDEKNLTYWCGNGQFDPARMSDTEYDLMNACELPVAREFWVNEYLNAFGEPKLTEQAAKNAICLGFIRTIHVREVLPGEGA